jgi:hypothetical protein
MLTRFTNKILCCRQPEQSCRIVNRSARCSQISIGKGAVKRGHNVHIRITLIKKKAKFYSNIRKFKWDRLQMRKGFLIYEEMRKYFTIYDEAVAR